MDSGPGSQQYPHWYGAIYSCLKYSTPIIMIIVAAACKFTKLIFRHALLEFAENVNAILSSVRLNIKLDEIHHILFSIVCSQPSPIV